MKTILSWRKKILSVVSVGLLAGSVLITSCNKEENNTTDNRMYAVSGNASGSQVSPPTSSTATGTLTGTYNANTNVMQYTISWNTLTAVASGVELRGPASAGANGTLVSALTITTPGITGTASGSVTLTASQESDLLAGKYYYAILTATNIAGEIRGQVTATAQ